MSMNHHRTYNIWIKATRAVQNTNTVYFQHAYITKPKVTKADIVADEATKLIKTIKGNYAAAHNDTEIEALNQLSQVFIDATKKLSGVEIKTAPEGQAPRVENRASTPRVEQTTTAQLATPTKPPPKVHKTHNNLPHLIPADISNDETSNDKTSNDNEEDNYYEPTPAFNTRTQAAKNKTFQSNIIRNAILFAVEMSLE